MMVKHLFGSPVEPFAPFPEGNFISECRKVLPKTEMHRLGENLIDVCPLCWAESLKYLNLKRGTNAEK